MNKLYVVVFVLLALMISSGSAQDKKKEKSKEVTITGQVTDMKCHFNGMEADMGDDHKQCAIDCIKGGLPVGLLDEKTHTMYVVVPKKGMKGANEDLVKYASQKVKMTGEMFESNGMKMIVYTKVEEAK